MNATQGTILIMIGALALWLTWSAKSPFGGATAGGSSAPLVPLPPENKDNSGKECPPGYIRSVFGVCVKQGTNSAGEPQQPSPVNPLLPLPFDCANRGGTWDFVHNVCVVKQ